MPRKTVDQAGKVIRQTPSTRPHPAGNRARTADGRVFDEQGHPVAAAAPARARAKPAADPGGSE